MIMNDKIQISVTATNTSAIIVDKLIPKIILGCFLSTLSVFTVCGNILVLYAIQTEKNLRTVSNLFILSLAIADLAVGLFVMPLSAANIIVGQWPFSSVICKMWLSTDYVASTASIFNLVLLSLDRYWAVVYPLRYLQKRTRRRATLFILIAWFISFLWAPAVIFWSYILPKHSDIIKEHECDTSFRSNKIFKTLTALVNFYIPLLAMIIVSYRIMVAIRLRSKMELGRRLSSATQRRMRETRIQKMSITNCELQTNSEIRHTHKVLSTPTIVANPLDPSVPDYQSLPTSKNENMNCTNDESQCLCSTCQGNNGVETDSLWELQQGPLRESHGSLKTSFSFTQIKPLSILFSSKKPKTENQKNNHSLDLLQHTSDHVDTKRNSSLSNSMKCSMMNYTRDHSRKHLSPTSKQSSIKRSTSGTLSEGSSMSDEYSETVITSPELIQEKSSLPCEVTQKKSGMSNNFLSISSFSRELKRTSSDPTRNRSVHIVTNNRSQNSPIDDTIKMNCLSFFNTLINPSRAHSLQKELKAARQLGMLVGVFAVSWLPYFILFLVVAWCNDCVPDGIYTASIWLGYINSTLNPLIYPLCNAHFRRSFAKICYCKPAKTKIPNLNALRELQALHARSRHRR